MKNREIDPNNASREKPVSNHVRMPNKVYGYYQGVFLQVTSHCNQRCLFCYSRRPGRRAHKSLSLVSEQLFQAKQLGADKIVVFSGGEFSTHPHIFEIIDLAHTLGFSYIYAYTNGQQFHCSKFVSEMARYGLCGAMISLHGSRSDVHNNLVGKEHFEDVLQGIENACLTGVDVTVNTVATTSNLDDIPVVYDLVQTLFPNVQSYRISYPAVMGSILGKPELIPSYEDVVSIISLCLSRVDRVPLECELIPICLLGINIGIAVEHCSSANRNLVFDSVASDYNRVGAKPCIRCSFRQVCRGLQYDVVRLYGVPAGYGGHQ